MRRGCISLLLLVFGLALTACYDNYEQEMIVVSKTPRGAQVGDKNPSGKPYEQDWYDIGLSRNGQEPIEYIFRVWDYVYDSDITDIEIGDKGTVYAAQKKPSLGSPRNKLHRPNAKKPPAMGIGRVFWENRNRYDMKKRNILLVLAFGLLLDTCSERDGQEYIIVNKIPRGAYANEDMSGMFRDSGWYDIGLSRNGQEPIEYIWRTGLEPYSHSIMKSEIGDKGVIRRSDRGRRERIRLPRPNAEKPSIIGMFGEARCERQKD